MKTGHELVDLSNKLISGPAVPELSKQKANPGQEDTGQAKAGEHKTKALEERDSDSPLLQELRAMRRRMDSTMELQRISGEKAISELRLELQSQIDDGEVKRLQSTIDYEKELTELRLLVSSLQCSVKDLTNYQITTVGVFYRSLAGLTDLKLCRTLSTLLGFRFGLWSTRSMHSSMKLSLATKSMTGIAT